MNRIRRLFRLGIGPQRILSFRRWSALAAYPIFLGVTLTFARVWWGWSFPVRAFTLGLDTFFAAFALHQLIVVRPTLARASRSRSEVPSTIDDDPFLGPTSDVTLS